MLTAGRDERSAFADDVLRIMADLRPEEAAALRLIYFLGHTQQQAARALGVSPATVGRRVAAGMRELTVRLSRTSA